MEINKWVKIHEIKSSSNIKTLKMKKSERYDEWCEK